jgi:hypothetical protein
MSEMLKSTQAVAEWTEKVALEIARDNPELFGRILKLHEALEKVADAEPNVKVWFVVTASFYASILKSIVEQSTKTSSEVLGSTRIN